MTTFQSNLCAIQARIDKATQASPHTATRIKLLAVSKTRQVEELRVAIDAGQQVFAENYLQEALDKMKALAHKTLEWHFIGPIQSNKTALIAQNFDWVHCIDRIKIAERLDKQRPTEAKALNVLIQVNVNQEASKSGVHFDQLSALAEKIITLPQLKLRGLMTIPAPSDEPEQQRENFHRLRLAKEQLNQKLGIELDQLSMGMSADYPIAIEEGATMIRIGTALFGKRPA